MTDPAPPIERYLDGQGGLRIFTRHWRPAGDAVPRAAIVLCHGVNSHGGQYLWPAGEFSRAGFAVTALDLRGRGRSDGERYYIDSIDDYVADVALAIDHAKAQDPGVPVFLLGHSAGGVTSVTYALDHQDQIAGLICESFAFRVFAPDFALKLLEGASHVLPHAHVLKLKNEDFSRDPDWVAALNADEYTQNESQPVATVAAFARAGERFEREFGRITLPLLILHGTADKATRPDGSQQFFDEAGSADKTLKLYDGHAHDLLNDLDRERVMADILGWIDAHLPTAAAPMSMTAPSATA
ncbi:alpha/beta hydrolase [Sphingomonas sp. LY29]|uniref:alpha/beta hydrolase n=1 Tax=Sphingomonas sp. LY29 TaxID=3095341 RepID=UPI002D771BA8|nr:lysophospholipase [Sphingomonas sp. LY29]WRP24850.1 alpha/beta hydrolase [Sphingomonas sp. LY29]